MADKIMLSIYTPNKVYFEGEVKMLIAPSVNGPLEILPNHISTVALLEPGTTEYILPDSKRIKAFTSKGVIKVKDSNVVITCEACEDPENIDKERALKAKERAEARIKEKTNIDMKRAEYSLKRALARIKIKGI